jgi:glycosyltransferase involved in cell wall biosynthesis
MREPLLSVCIITYNHSLFIRQAIDSVLAQRVDFPYEIVIADDCSKDETRSIVSAYEQQNKGLIRTIFQEKNVGAEQNWFDLIFSARGKYIAYLEGDDFWTDPQKLQKQVEFLESNQDFSICVHSTEILPPEEDKIDRLKKAKSYSFTFIDSLQQKQGASLTTVIRTEIIHKPKFKQLVGGLLGGDWPLECFALLYGKGYFMNDCMGVYRRHSGGATNSFNSTLKFLDYRITFCNRLLNYYPDEVRKYSAWIFSFLSRLYFQFVLFNISNRIIKGTLSHAMRVLKNFILSFGSDDLRWIRRFQYKVILMRFIKGDFKEV